MYNGYNYYNNAYGVNGSYGTYGNVNPMQSQNDRLNQMQQPQQASTPQQLAGQQIIPVGGIEEVKAHQVDWSGKPSYFIDNVNNKIYIKRLSMEGVPVISTYSLDNTPQEKKDIYCTKEELNGLKSELDNYKSILNDLLGKLGGLKDDE